MADHVPSEPRVVELTATSTVAVRVQQAMAELDLAAVFDRYPSEIAKRLETLGVAPSGPLIGRYHEFGPQRVDVEVWFPVDAPVDGLPALAECEAGEIGSSELPAGSAASFVHVGSYDGLRGAYDRLHSWIHDHGDDEGPGPWESYLDLPGQVDQASLRTEVIWPLARAG